MPHPKPSLPALRTPVTATFPMSDGIPLSAFSVKTPLSAKSGYRESFPSAGLPSAGLPSAGLTPGFPPAGPLSVVKAEEKTPITPPVAYLDFLRSIPLASPNLASPPQTGKPPTKRTSTSASIDSDSTASSDSASADAGADADGETTCVESGPSTATSDASDCSCTCDHVHKSPGGLNYPLSAPPCGPTTFPSIHIPRSPAPGVDSPVASPFSARSVRSPFDWDAALKARRFAEVTSNGLVGKTGHSHTCGKTGRTSVRHIREVVTRTVTYTPRMNPAPKGKRRKVE